MQLLHFPHQHAEDVLSAHLEVARGAPFCANRDCALHVRLVDDRVAGGGNWVVLPDGRIFGRGRYAAALLCDACGTHRGPVRLTATMSATQAPPPPVQMPCTLRPRATLAHLVDVPLIKLKL